MDSKQDLKEEIARVAYEIYEQRISNQALEDWLKAERIVLGRLLVRKPSKAAKKLVPFRKKSGTTKKNPKE